jgi:hypothetical protein
MTIALIISAIGLAAAVLFVGHATHPRRRSSVWHEPPPAQTVTIRAKRPRRRPF